VLKRHSFVDIYSVDVQQYLIKTYHTQPKGAVSKAKNVKPAPLSHLSWATQCLHKLQSPMIAISIILGTVQCLWTLHNAAGANLHLSPGTVLER